MGTRSWACEVDKYNEGDKIYVKAGHFDSDRDKYSDFFAHKAETLLEGVVLSVHSTSIRAKFVIDNSVSSIKLKDIQRVTDANKHLIYVGKSISL